MKYVVLVVLALGYALLVWAGFKRCRKCGGWCLDEFDCAERQARKEGK